MTQHGPRRIELVEAELPMENVAADKAELALEVERGEDLVAR